MDVARRIADEVLFPRAMETDRADLVPKDNLDALAEAGLYGMAGPVGAGGLQLDILEACGVVETLAGGCLATTFIWLQHQGLLLALSFGGTDELRDEWLGPLCRGERRAGVALAGTVPGPPQLRATPSTGGAWIVDGTSPWVTGWGLIDVVQVVARGPDETLVTLLVDAVEGPRMKVTRQRLVAVDASATVQIDFGGFEVPAERVIGAGPFNPAASLFAPPLRINGSLALGVASRCLRLMGPGLMDDELVACRSELDAALGPEGDIAAARARASEFALRAAAALSVHQGSRSVLVDQHAQRLVREGLFLLVFGTRPPIRDALLSRLTRV